MANAVATPYRDMQLSDRSPDASIAAMFAYLEQSVSAQPPLPSLPPLVPAGRIGTQNLPPVRNLLKQPEDWTKTKQDSSVKVNKSIAGKVLPTAKSAGPVEGGKLARTGDKPLKRGPKGPRKYSAPRPLGPLKPIAPKVPERPPEEIPAKGKQKKGTSAKTRKRGGKREKQPNQEDVQSAAANPSMAPNTLINLGGSSDLDVSHAFNVSDYTNMESSMLGSGNASINGSTFNGPNQSPPFQELQPANLSSLQAGPHSRNNVHQPTITGIPYTSPQASFSPASDTAPTGFAPIYQSPAFPTTHSGHVSPHSTISPLHSIHSSPRAIRSTLDPIQGLQSPVPQISLSSPVQVYPSRLANGSESSPDLISPNISFQPLTGLDSTRSNAVNGAASRPTIKRRRTQDSAGDTSNGKWRLSKPNAAVSTIQSVLNPPNDGRVDIGSQERPARPTSLTSKQQSLSPKKKRTLLPLTPTSPKHLRPLREAGMTTPGLLLPQGMPTALSEHFPDTAPLHEDQNRAFDLQNANSLAMVLNSEQGSALASPQLYDFPPLDTTAGTSSDILPASAPRDVTGRLPVQSLLSLPPMPSENSPSMQVMQIQPALLDEASSLRSLGLEQRQAQASEAANPFEIPMTVNSQASFGSGLADVVGPSLQSSSSWVDILLQPNATPTFPTEITNPSEPIFDSNRITAIEDRPQDSALVPYQPDPQSEERLPPLPSAESDVKEVKKPEPASPSDNDRIKRKRRGKHSRYVAAAGENGEPDKTHIDVLVKVIQKNEKDKDQSTQSGASSEIAYENPLQPSMDDALAALSTQNSLPPIDTLQLVDTAANTAQSAQGRTILDEMAGLPSSSTEHSASTMPYSVMDFFSQDNLDGWNDLLLPSSGGQIPVPVRYGQWNQNDYHDPPAVDAPLDEVDSPKRLRKVRDDQSKRDRHKGQHIGIGLVKRKRKGLPHACQRPGCNARFQQLQHLKTHVASHEGIKPFRCDFEGCNKSFSQKGNLKAHQRKHTGEKPFVCEQCDKAFAQKGNLQTHRSVHTGSKPYLCLIDNCTARYSQRGNLKMHQNKFHTETIQRLTMRYDESTKGGLPLTEDEKKLADHLKILYKFANKGIKGRGKKRDNDPKPPPNNAATVTTAPPELRVEQPLDRTTTTVPTVFGEQTLLPLPVSKAPPALRGMDGAVTSFMALTHPASSWSRGEDVFVGNQGHGQGQSTTFLGIPGDGNPGGLGGYAFGNMG